MKDKVKEWAKAAGVRAVKTAAQTAVGVIGAAAVMGEVQWAVVGSAAALAAVVSLLTSVAGMPEVEGGASVAKIAKGGDGR
ncbi:holin [Eggerthella timonensis]|uniref:holin n=1 Tax=Eggerthella timonensis TaxID=1871008 RepID=UPI000C7837F5|nr:holin [Eggerthella timonensis]